MIIDSMSAACLRYLSQPLTGSVPVPFGTCPPLAGVSFAGAQLSLLAAPHTIRLDAAQLRTLARHHDASIGFITWARDGSVCVDVVLRRAGGFNALRGLAVLELGDRLWLRADDGRVWLTLGAGGLRASERPPTTDAVSITAAAARARGAIARLADGAAHVRELRA